MRGLWLLAALTAAPVFAQPGWNFESAWSAHQVFSTSATAAGVETATSVSGFTLPGLWGGAIFGVEAATRPAGAFQSLFSYGALRAGLQFPWEEAVLTVPWAGGQAGWDWAPDAGRGRWAFEAGVDAEVRLWGGQYLLAGLSWRSEGSWAVSLGFRARQSWAPPVPAFPLLSVEAGPGPFSPDGDGSHDKLPLRFQAGGGDPVSRWAWVVLDPKGRVFYQQAGQGTVPETILWDGLSLLGEPAASAAEYRLVLTVADDRGRVGRVQSSFVTDFVVLRENGRPLIRLSPDASDQVIGEAADRLRRLGVNRLTVTVHTNLVQWLNPVRAAQEETSSALPQTLQKAETVKALLVSRGWLAQAVNAVGAGGSRPLFPFGDEDNAWKNERLELSGDPGPPR